MQRFDVIIVGAGLAGLSAAYSLASEGISPLVIERGDYPGAKSVTGGRIYLKPIRHFFPELWEEAPFERHVVKEKLTMMAEDSSTSVELVSEDFNRKPYHSFTILRSKFDRWFSEKVTEKKGMIITKNKVDDLILDNGKVVGIVAGGDEIPANVVIAADGAMSLMADKAGLRGKHRPEDFAVGIKEVIELSPEVIEERFNLSDGEGASQLFMGSLTRGMFGAAFLYTNMDSLSLGLVLRIKDLMEKQPPLEAYRLMEDIKHRPEIGNLVKGGESVEYSAHVISEGGINVMPRLYSDGILLAGDAAGFTLNAGITVRGMEFAVASGALAAQAVKIAREKNDFSAQSLSVYLDMLRDSFVLKDLNAFRRLPGFLDNPRLFTLYPEMVCSLLGRLMLVDEGPKERLSATVRKGISFKQRLLMLKDAIGALRV